MAAILQRTGLELSMPHSMMAVEAFLCVEVFGAIRAGLLLLASSLVCLLLLG